MTESRYVHGTDPVEQRRLTRMNELLNATTLEAMAPAPGDRVLDVGSGLGLLSRSIARAVGPQGKVIGIERSSDQIAEAERMAHEAGESGLAEFREGDAYAFPLAEHEWRSFDVVHARFILEHVPDPLAVVKHMVRAALPGGRITLEDDDHDVLRLWPEPEGFAEVWRHYMRVYDAHGNDPIVGRRLVELLHAAGARPRRNRWLFFGGCAGEPDFVDYVENIARILEGAAAEIVRVGKIEDRELRRVIEVVRAWGGRPDAAIWFARSWAEGISP
jgi:ubiquinone/menaquinone biosynthesis C-methylase UbiE